MGKKEVSGSATVVLTVDLHCEGCAHKVKRTIKHLTGVESVSTDLSAHKITVTGKVDPAKVKEKVEKRIKKKVELVSPKPQPPIKEEKENKNSEKKNGDGGENGRGENSDDKSEKKPPPSAEDNKKKEGKKSKEPEMTTVVLKTKVHCDGCAQKINKIINKCEGVKEVNVDLAKNQITLKGTMNMKEILPYLNTKFKRLVEIVSPPFSKGGDKNPKDEKGKGVVNNEGDKKNKKKIDESVSDGGEGGSKMAGEEKVSKVENVNKLEHLAQQIGYGTHGYNPQQAQGYGYAEHWNGPDYMHPQEQYHAPQMFSDENPNACSIM